MSDLTIIDNSLNKLLLEIQKENQYEIIQKALGNLIYEAIVSNNIFLLSIQQEKLFYIKNKNNVEQSALEVIDNMLNNKINKNSILDSLEKIKNDFKKQANTDMSYLRDIYYKTISDIRKFVLNFLVDKKISLEDLTEINEKINSFYSECVINNK